MKQKRKKVICIANDVWPDSDEKWGFNRILDEGFDMEIWKVGAITVGTKIWDKQPYKIPSVKVKSWKQFYSILLRQKMKKTIFLFYSQYDCFNIAQIIIKVLGGKYCKVILNSVVSKTYFDNFEKLKSKKIHYMDLFPSTYNFLPTEINKGDLHSWYEANRKKNIILHSYNYDFYLETKRKPDVEEKDYIVFVDQNLLEHKDLVNFSQGRYVRNRKKYICDVNNFLDYLEKYYRCDVIIAAHPTADYSRDNMYNERKIVYGDSCRYIKNSKLVVAFSSSSIDFAILYNVPILFYYSDDLKNGILYKDYFIPKVKALKGKLLNISQLDNDLYLDDYVVNTKYYCQYMNYIVGNVTNELYIDGVLKYLDKIDYNEIFRST